MKSLYTVGCLLGFALGFSLRAVGLSLLVALGVLAGWVLGAAALLLLPIVGLFFIGWKLVTTFKAAVVVFVRAS